VLGYTKDPRERKVKKLKKRIRNLKQRISGNPRNGEERRNLL
jgi:hypothetical protein